MEKQVRRGFPYLYENVKFYIDWDIWYKLINDYRVAVLEFVKKHKNEIKVDYVKVIYFDDLCKFIFENFKDVLPLDLEIEIRRGFFERYFKNFKIGIEAIEYESTKKVELIPKFKYDAIYQGRFEVNEKFV